MQVQALVARAPPWEAAVRAMDALGPGVEDIKVAAWMCNPDAFADKEGDGKKARAVACTGACTAPLERDGAFQGRSA